MNIAVYVADLVNCLFVLPHINFHHCCLYLYIGSFWHSCTGSCSVSCVRGNSGRFITWIDWLGIIIGACCLSDKSCLWPNWYILFSCCCWLFFFYLLLCCWLQLRRINIKFRNFLLIWCLRLSHISKRWTLWPKTRSIWVVMGVRLEQPIDAFNEKTLCKYSPSVGIKRL